MTLEKQNKLGYIKTRQEQSETNWFILKLDNIKVKQTAKKNKLSFFLRKGSIVNYQKFPIPTFVRLTTLCSFLMEVHYSRYFNKNFQLHMCVQGVYSSTEK